MTTHVDRQRAAVVLSAKHTPQFNVADVVHTSVKRVKAVSLETKPHKHAEVTSRSIYVYVCRDYTGLAHSLCL